MSQCGGNFPFIEIQELARAVAPNPSLDSLCASRLGLSLDKSFQCTITRNCRLERDFSSHSVSDSRLGIPRQQLGITSADGCPYKICSPGRMGFASTFGPLLGTRL